MERTKLPKVQGFYLTITPNQGFLNLEIEEEKTGHFSSTNIDFVQIPDLTGECFQNPEDFMKGLKDAVDTRCPGLELILSLRRLTYKASFTLGTTDKECSFTITIPERAGFVAQQVQTLKDESARFRQEIDTRVSGLEASQKQTDAQLQSIDQKMNQLIQMAQNSRANSRIGSVRSSQASSLRPLPQECGGSYSPAQSIYEAGPPKDYCSFQTFQTKSTLAVANATLKRSRVSKIFAFFGCPI